ncbi:MAG: hypothetical protein JNM72_24260, partial [Deltaproteobacteria bacterium]|nr:hypothetical protein [Deltaproteobacteria bacterium]
MTGTPRTGLGLPVRAYAELRPAWVGPLGRVSRGRGPHPDEGLCTISGPDAADVVEAFELRRRRQERVVGAQLLRDRGAFLVQGEVTLVTEWQSGVPLAELLAEGPLPVGVACAICREIGAALHEAWDRTHRRRREPLRLIHGDLSPLAVLVRGTGEVRLMGLGNLPADTPTDRDALRQRLQWPSAATAPEALRGVYLHAGDVYALGAILAQLVSGEAPSFASAQADWHEAAVSGITERVRHLTGIGALAELVGWSLSFEPQARPMASEFCSWIDKVLQGLPPARFAAWCAERVPAALARCAEELAEADSLAAISAQQEAPTTALSDRLRRALGPGWDPDPRRSHADRLASAAEPATQQVGSKPSVEDWGAPSLPEDGDEHTDELQTQVVRSPEPATAPSPTLALPRAPEAGAPQADPAPEDPSEDPSEDPAAASSEHQPESPRYIVLDDVLNDQAPPAAAEAEGALPLDAPEAERPAAAAPAGEGPTGAVEAEAPEEELSSGLRAALDRVHAAPTAAAWAAPRAPQPEQNVFVFDEVPLDGRADAAPPAPAAPLRPDPALMRDELPLPGAIPEDQLPLAAEEGAEDGVEDDEDEPLPTEGEEESHGLTLRLVRPGEAPSAVARPAASGRGAAPPAAPAPRPEGLAAVQLVAPSRPGPAVEQAPVDRGPAPVSPRGPTAPTRTPAPPPPATAPTAERATAASPPPDRTEAGARDV